MSRVDDVLAALDVGLQRPGAEYGYGADAGPDRCARCLGARDRPDGDLCAGCRSYLLGDSDNDPRRKHFVDRTGIALMEQRLRRAGDAARDLAESIEQVNHDTTRSARSLSEWRRWWNSE
jgi:hypothetical protein